MGKRRSKRREQNGAVAQQGEAQSQSTCPYCGTTPSEKAALYLMDQLFRSHTELCATLRLAGRQMLQFEQQPEGSLETIRKVLKRADNLRKALQNTEELPEAPQPAEELVVAQNPVPEFSVEKIVNEGPRRKGVQKRTRFARPRSLRIISFPNG
jgi:hypothetical protein